MDGEPAGGRNEVVVFGREPRAGLVKTRLAAAVGGEVAARLYAGMLEHTLAQAGASGMDVVLALAEPPSPAWRPSQGIEVMVQVGDDLGARMANAFAARFAAGAEVVVLIGSDLPRISSAHLQGAAAACRTVRAALGPSVDGGYWLLAQRAPGVDLFAGVPWSDRGTLAATRDRLAVLGVPHVELEMLADIDEADDLEAALTDPRLDAGLAERLRDVLRSASPQLRGRRVCR